jgi:hypothetical protein
MNTSELRNQMLALRAFNLITNLNHDLTVVATN